MNHTKQAIYEAAVDIFSQSGYTGAAMEEIAERAGVAKGTLYYHFKSKEELFLFAMQTGLDHMIEDAKKTLSKPLAPAEKLKALCQSQLQIILRKNKNFIKVVLSQLFGYEERQQTLRDKLNEYMRLIESCILPLMDLKEPSNETEAAVLGFLGTLISAAVHDTLSGSSKKNMSGLLIQNYLKGILS